MNALQTLIEKKKRQLPPRTDAYRVADGSPWPGVFIDALADRLLVSLRDTGVPGGLRDLLHETGLPVFVKRLDKGVKEAPTQLCGPELPLRFPIEENGLKYLMDMGAGYSQGIFLDQRDHRAELRRRCMRGMSVLNTFSYTGAFSVCAAKAGAVTTSLDLAQPCLNWCRANMEINGIDPSGHYFCKGDTLHWLARFARQGRRFDAIVLDPPTFSRDEKGHVWRVERDYGRLVSLALDCLAPRGFLLCTTNCRKLSHSAFLRQVQQAAPLCRCETRRMPFDFDGEDYLKCLWVNS